MGDESFTVDAEFAQLIPPLAAEERAELEASILAHGCRDALTVWDGILLDGHTRLGICERYGIAYHTKAIKLPSRDAALCWLEQNQLGRRNLTDDQRAVIADSLYERRSALAKTERAVKANDQKYGRSLKDNVSCKEKKPQTRTAVAREARIPERKLRAVHEVKKTNPDALARVRSGEVSLADARREVHRATVKASLESIEAKEAKAIDGVYDVIVIDPPWPMEKIERDVRPHQAGFDYPIMTEKQLGQLSIPVAKTCHVWLWTTQKFLPMALRLLDAWGLKYVCTFVWHKPGGFQPVGLPQFNCEFALYARKGSPEFLTTKGFPTCFHAPRGRHSEKPAEFYDIIRRVTGGRRLDMFNRRKIEEFDRWGNEA